MKKEEKELDMVIIGAGPAGLTAGIYAARLNLNLIILEDEIVGGQIREAYLVENYPGFTSISGSDLTEKIRNQAQSSGAAIDEFDTIVAVKLTDEEKIIETDSYIYKPRVVIIAGGAKKLELPIKEEKRFHGKGIHYCEICDGHMYQGKHLAVVGGGSSALLASKFLTKYAEKITIINRRDHFKGETKLLKELSEDSKINFIWNSKVSSAKGDERLEGLVLENLVTGHTVDLIVDGVFVYIGLVPRTGLYKDYLKLSETGNIIAGENCETNVKGVYAAGDIRTKLFRQVTTSVSDGTVAVLMAEKYITENYKT